MGGADVPPFDRGGDNGCLLFCKAGQLLRDDLCRTVSACHFNPSFIGQSGSEAELVEMRDDYGIFRETVESTSAAGYFVNHAARITLIDANGNLRVSFPYDIQSKDIVHDVRLLLE